MEAAIESKDSFIVSFVLILACVIGVTIAISTITIAIAYPMISTNLTASITENNQTDAGQISSSSSKKTSDTPKSIISNMK